MTTHWLRTLPLPLVILGLALAGPACVGFISGDDATGDGDTSGDGDPGDGDGDPGDGDGDGGNDMTIYEIQEGANNGSFLPMTPVEVKGVIVVSPFDVENGLVFVEEPDGGEWSGIALYIWEEEGVMPPVLQPGDVVDIVGEYDEYYDVSQIVIENPGDIVVVGSVAMNELPGPDVVTAADVARDNLAAEPWEGVRVRINDATIQEPSDDFGQYVLVGDALVGYSFVNLPDVAVGGSFASITGSLHHSFDEFKVLPAFLSDLDGYTGPPAPMEDTTIYDIQQGQVDEGTLVLIENVIASSGLTWSDDAEASFYIQEPGGGAFSGIQVHVNNTMGLQVAPGDDVTVVGTYEEFFEMSQIDMADASGVTVNNNGAAPTAEVVDPIMIATGGGMSEDWEGVLVSVEMVSVIDENPDAPDDFGEFTVTGDLRVADDFFSFDNWMKPAMGTSYASITGLLNFAYDNFKLEPRDNADLVTN